MSMAQVHYPGIHPGGVKSFILICEKCGGEIELIKDGKPNGGKCKNPQCLMHQKNISLVFSHAETICGYN